MEEYTKKKAGFLVFTQSKRGPKNKIVLGRIEKKRRGPFLNHLCSPEKIKEKTFSKKETKKFFLYKSSVLLTLKKTPKSKYFRMFRRQKKLTKNDGNIIIAAKNEE